MAYASQNRTYTEERAYGYVHMWDNRDQMPLKFKQNSNSIVLGGVFDAYDFEVRELLDCYVGAILPNLSRLLAIPAP